jgi:antirestriction protein ArdC
MYDRQPVYEKVANTIIGQLEQGTAPWRQSWNGGASLDMPVNKVTGNHYHGINIPLLWLSAEEQGFQSQEWASFKQWSDKKETVAKGQKGTMIVHYDTFTKQGPDDEEAQVIPFLKSYYVFNKAQLKGYDPEKEMKIVGAELPERLHRAEEFVFNTGADILDNGGNRAYYDMRADNIHMPYIGDFIGSETQTPQEAYYTTLFHELAHWTGAESRLNRDFRKRMDVGWRVTEEIVAEVTSAFLCSSLDITDGPKRDHADYIAPFLEVAKESPKLIITVASVAGKAAEYLHAFTDNKKVAEPVNIDRVQKHGYSPPMR